MIWGRPALRKTPLVPQLGLTVLHITHNLGLVARSCERLAVMYAGRVVEESPVRELFDNPKHRCTQALNSAIPEPDPDLQREGIFMRGDLSQPFPECGCPFAPRCHADKLAECDKVSAPMLELQRGHQVACHLHPPPPGMGRA